MIEASLRMAQAASFGAFGDSAMAESFRPRETLTPETFAGRWRIARVLQRIELAVGEFANLLFAYFDAKEIWTSGGRTDFEFFFDKVYRYKQYDSSFFRSYLATGKPFSVLSATNVSGLATRAGDRVIPVIIKGKIEDKNAVIALNVSAGAIERTLKGSAIFPTTSFMVLAADGSGILAADGSIGGWEPSLASLTPGADTSIAILGKRYLMSCRAPGVSGWTYIALTPVDSVAALESGILKTILYICAVLIVMSLGFAFFFSSVIYSPIRAIRDLVASIDKIERIQEGRGRSVSRFRGDDFDIIRSGLDRLQREGEATKVIADGWTREYVESAFRFILRGHRLGNEAVLREALESEYGFSGKGYACAAVKVDFSRDWFESRQDTERLRISGGLKDLLRGLITSRIASVSFEYRQDWLAVVADMAGASETSGLAAALEDVVGSLDYGEGSYAIFVGVGGYRDRVDDLSRSWDEALIASAKINIAQRFSVVEHAEEGAGAGRARATFTPLDEQELVNALREGSRERIAGIIGRLFDAGLKAGASWSALCDLRSDLVACGRRFFAESGGGPEPPECSCSSPGQEDDTLGVDELRDSAARRLSAIAEAASEIAGGGQGGLVPAIERYIESHYDAGLCLERIADEMGVSAKYVSRIFKEERGENLTDRIDRVRMAKAKELILAGGLGISEISKRVGIESRATFLRVFRRTEGVSPSEYRDRFARTPQP